MAVLRVGLGRVEGSIEERADQSRGPGQLAAYAAGLGEPLLRGSTAWGIRRNEIERRRTRADRFVGRLERGSQPRADVVTLVDQVDADPITGPYELAQPGRGGCVSNPFGRTPEQWFQPVLLRAGQRSVGVLDVAAHQAEALAVPPPQLLELRKRRSQQPLDVLRRQLDALPRDHRQQLDAAITVYAVEDAENALPPKCVRALQDLLNLRQRPSFRPGCPGLTVEGLQRSHHHRGGLTIAPVRHTIACLRHAQPPTS
ncbi:hypothetical protein ACIBG5_05010 [Kribbella sp. NPDC050241]|uniref:hypothetical protein n=1 Tax=Kribbella sp. NPDC050241 TaxID=3364115 RepID=UPI0037942B02